MEEPSKIQKLIWFIQELPQRIKQAFCVHKFELDMRQYVDDRWGRCSGVVDCSKCHLNANYTVYLFEKP
jgi:hypothetical protein